MGFDPLTIGLGLSAASSIYGAFSNNKAQKRAQNTADQNFGLQQQAYNDARGDLAAKNQQMQNLILPMLNGSGYNTGQDGMMQSMRGLPDGRFDTSDYFNSIKALSNQDLNDQIAAQRGQVGSLGQRFGTAQSRIEAGLRERATVGLGAQYAQTGLQAFESAANRRQNNTLGLLGLLAGQQTNPGMPVPQMPIMQGGQSAGAGALGDLGNLAMLYPFLRGLGGGGGGGYGRGMTPPIFPTDLGGGRGIPGSLFGGVRY
jgi:hypothetical protein